MSIPKLVEGIDREAPTPVTPEIVAASQAAPGLWLIFDTETTGLVNDATSDVSQQPHVIEFAGVHMDGAGEIVKEISVLFKPPIPKLPEVITKITGLTDEDLKDKPSFNCDVVDKFVNAEGVTTAVAHNFSFDQSMLSFEFIRAGRQMVWPARKICTVEASMAIRGRRMKLGDLHREFFGEGIVGAHRALADVKALARIVQFMRVKGML